MSDNPLESVCTSCDSGTGQPSRRAFLQLAACLTVSAASLGFDAADATALPITEGEGAQAGSERRYPVPPGDGVTIDRASQVIVVRYLGHMYAFNLSCPHQNNALKWLPKEGRFQCPKHESKYQPTGVFIDGRATRNMDRIAVRLDGAMLVADLDKWFQSDKDPSGWAAAAVALA
jgi:nitrite reductase/ring-hydroxylating ferredoxin subunit